MTSLDRTHRPNRNAQIIAMALMGAGLLILGALALVLLPGWLEGQAQAQTGQTSSGEYISAVPVAVSYPAPQLELVGFDGRPVSLEDFRGQVVLVNHWATWCPPCKAEMPVLQGYYEEHRAAGFTIVAVEAGTNSDEVAGFVEAYQLTFPVWPDPQESGMRAFRQEILPASYVIDARGQVVLYWTGAVSREMLEKHVTPLLKDTTHGS